MKRTVRKWIFQLTATGIVILGILTSLVFIPSLLYANETKIGNYTIHHNGILEKEFINQLEHLTFHLKMSELYDPSFELDICLNDKSLYPSLISRILGPAFARGFYNKIVLHGNAIFNGNMIELNGYSWNLEQLITHEAIHCYQYNKFGFWGSNPVVNLPNWKWEGYPEYVARQNPDQQDLFDNISRLLISEKENKGRWAIEFSDKTIAPMDYYKDWLLVSYCLDIKQFTYVELLKDSTKKEIIASEMMRWYQQEIKTMSNVSEDLN